MESHRWNQSELDRGPKNLSWGAVEGSAVVGAQKEKERHGVHSRNNALHDE